MVTPDGVYAEETAPRVLGVNQNKGNEIIQRWIIAVLAIPGRYSRSDFDQYKGLPLMGRDIYSGFVNFPFSSHASLYIISLNSSVNPNCFGYDQYGSDGIKIDWEFE